jgi:outer membrane protein OmpA-like peptidoglycan-associated protein
MKAILTHITAFILGLIVICGGGKAHAQSAGCRDIGSDTVQFETRSTTMKAAGKEKLAQLAQQMKGNSCKVVILGNGGGSRYNEMRVEKVIEYMVTNFGIERDRFVATYKGPARGYAVIYSVAEE